jgi:uncharacterized protein involved in exopolysaccharide biosynthesis
VLIYGTFKFVVNKMAALRCSGIRAYLSPPTYSAGFDILIQPLSAETEVISALLDVPINRKEAELPLSDRIKILISPGVLQPVVDNLRAQGMLGGSL